MAIVPKLCDSCPSAGMCLVGTFDQRGSTKAITDAIPGCREAMQVETRTPTSNE